MEARAKRGAMATKESGFQLTGAGPAGYERYMIPAHCDARAEDLLRRVNPQPQEHLLDIACGTGIVTRRAAPLVGDLGRVVGTELNPQMLQVARELSAYQDSVEFIEGDAEALPVPDGSFDIALCQQAFMFFPNQVVAAQEIHRALKPGGRTAISVFRTLQHNPAFEHLVRALEKHAGTEAAAFMRSPFIFENPEQIRAPFIKAGFKKVTVIVRVAPLRYPSIRHMVRYETLNVSDPSLHTGEMQTMLCNEMESAAAEYTDDHGVVFPSQDFVVHTTK